MKKPRIGSAGIFFSKYFNLEVLIKFGLAG